MDSALNHMQFNSASHADYSQGFSACHALRPTQKCETISAMHIGEEIRRIRKAKKMTLQAMADEVGTDTGNLSRLERGAQGYSEDLIKRIATALGVKLSDLFAAVEGSKPQGMGNISPAAPSTRRIPVINYVQAGNPREIVDAYAPGDGLKHIYSNQELGEHAFALIIEGDSMTPDFKEGDEVIVDPSVSPRPGSFVVAKCCNSEKATFKKYRPRGVDEEGHEIFELAPLNQDYATIVSSSKNPCTIVGTMVEHRRYFR